MAPTGRRKRGSCWRTGARRRQGPAVPGAGPACFSRDSVAESETPVFQAFLTTPSEQQRFTFPAPQDTGAGHFDTDPSSPHGDPGPRYPQPATDPSPPHRETEPTRPHWETAPKSPLYETAPKYPYQETDAKYPYQETGPKYPYQETGPKYPDQQTDPKYPYSETDPKYPFSQTDTRYPKQETDPKYPYQETDSKYTYQETFPKYPYQETDPKYPDAERTPPGGRRPVTAAGAGGRRFSEAASPRPRRLDETGRSQSEEGWRLPPTRVLLEQATLESDETGSPGVSSDMRGLHMDVRDSSNVHVGPKVIDQRNIHVARLDSRVDNLHRHEHVQEKHEHIRSKHEHVQNKTEVHSKTENIKHEHIQNKHEYIQVNKTEIVHTNAKAIFADRLYFGYDCSVRHDAAARSAPSSPSRVSLEPRQFQEGRRFLETRYTSWTTLSMPLPWYDDMVLDLSKSCVDFTMVSTGSGSVGTYNGVEQLVREQLGRQQQPERALRIVVEGHAGYGKTTLAAKVAYDWATGQDYLKQFSHAFLVLLREFRGSLDEHIKSQHYPLELGDGDAFLQYLKTNQEKVLFIFDGYDELPKEGRETIDQIMSGRAFVHSGAVMTSRPMTMMFKKYCQVVGLVGFDDRKKSEFVRLVYKDRPQMRIDAFLRVLAGDRSVSELAQCPLMCLLLCEMHQRGAFGGRATKSKLYSELFLYLVDKAVHRRLPQPLAEERARLAASYDEALGRFGQFCLQCLACDQLSFTEQQIPKGCEAGKLFDVGFIVKCRNFTSYMGSETYYEPIHKTFMEFLAAKYLKSIVHEEEHLKRELLRLRQGTSRASERTGPAVSVRPAAGRRLDRHGAAGCG
ncbi:uncharacterized protein LOC119111861 isoform X2 [Pollicipes pollicipes]|uniref:uncharacterized protein LOC119111861 isoform X2 n=1 Tax=Pollicipes pollicipes TaxID=41117 RepID=UPI001884D619|nr:uncharacterized protein LOC119111861 isoform X2 [Pollicipes pollicipes]